jgi:hypothetical protein
VKRTGRGESIGAVIHIHMGTTQGNSLCNYLYLKRHVLCFIYYVFSSTKSENKRTEQVQLALMEGERWLRKGQEDESDTNKVYTCM